MITSCSKPGNESTEQIKLNEKPEAEEEYRFPDTDSEEHAIIRDSLKKSEEPEDFYVKLDADSLFTVNEPGEMSVWIGNESFRPITNMGVVSADTTIPAEIGQYAKVIPYAPDFDILESRGCIKIDPTGSFVRFTIVPREQGDFKISADVEIYDNDNCSGAFVPKTTRTLTVHVEVDNEKPINTNSDINNENEPDVDNNQTSKLEELWDTFWAKFVIFFGMVLSILFGAVITHIHRKVNKKSKKKE